jgi:hypothetical protein
MNDLFSEDPQFRRVQYTKVSDNVQEWPQEIGALVAERLPQDLQLAVEVVFQKTDEEKGYAIGTAIATDPATGKAIGVPIIVKAWHAAPFDLFFQSDRVYPLTKDNLARAFYHGSLGAGVATDRPPPNLADDVFADVRNPPLGGKYSYSSPVSMLKLISGTLGAEDLAHFKTACLQQPEALAAYHKRGTFELLCKYAEEKPKPTDQDNIDIERGKAVMAIKKDGPDAYRVFSNNDTVYDPILISTDRQGLKEILNMRRAEFWDYEQDPLNSIDQYGEFQIIPPKGVYGLDVDGPAGGGGDGSGSYAAQLGPRKNPFVFDPLQDDRLVRTIDRFGRYAVRDRDGVLAKGWVIPNVVSFDGGKVDVKLFLGPALASIQGRISGIPMNDDADVSLQADKPETGKIGTLVYREGERVLATVPFQVMNVTVYKNMRSIGVVTYKGERANLILSPTVDGIVPVTASESKLLGPLLGPKKNYIVSAKMFFVRMPRLCPVSEGPDDFKKAAAAYLDHSPLKVSMANGRYVFRSTRLDKYASVSKATKAAQAAMGAVEGQSLRQLAAKKMKGTIAKAAFDYNSLGRQEAGFLLGVFGLGHKKVAEVLDQAKSRISVEVHHLKYPEVASQTKTASALSDYARSLRNDVSASVKCAAVLEDATAVDTILSLAFVNGENIARFAAAKPMLEEVSSVLAKLLLAARLGADDIPEESARAALGHLQKVIDGLGKLKERGEYEEKTSAARTVPRRVADGRQTQQTT